MRQSEGNLFELPGDRNLRFRRKPLWAMMIRAELLKMLVCPETQTSLSVASNELIARLNREIALGRLKNKAGQKLKMPLEGGLLRADHCVLYPIVDDIPMMLVDEAIPLNPALLESS